MFFARPPMNVSSASTGPANGPPVSVAQASRMRWSMNPAVFCETPISRLGPLPAEFLKLELSTLRIENNASLCVPADGAFESWLATIGFAQILLQGGRVTAAAPLTTLLIVCVSIGLTACRVYFSGRRGAGVSRFSWRRRRRCRS